MYDDFLTIPHEELNKEKIESLITKAFEISLITVLNMKQQFDF